MRRACFSLVCLMSLSACVVAPPPPAPVMVGPGYAYAEPYGYPGYYGYGGVYAFDYPVFIDHHRHYDWGYWRGRDEGWRRRW